MPSPLIVVPNRPGLLGRLTGRRLAPRVSSIDQAATAARRARAGGNELVCVIVDAEAKLAELETSAVPAEIPLAIMVSGLGAFRDARAKIADLRCRDVRVFLPGDTADDVTAIKILASLGVPVTAHFGPHADWEAAADLLAYALLGRAPHGPIEPFAFMAAHFDPAGYLAWGRVALDDPSHVLHLDAHGRVALSRRELLKKKFVANDIEAIGDVDSFHPIVERREAWRRYFADAHPCASCAGWKLCLGRFSASRAANPGCAAFFAEAIEVVRQHQNLHRVPEETGPWQP